jgi:hypothetical protein
MLYSFYSFLLHLILKGVLVDSFGRGMGYMRQIYSNLYADKFTTKEYIGIVDADASFVTPILPEMLFKKVNHEYVPVVLGYNDPFSTKWCNQKVIEGLGKPCVAEFMVK